MWIEKANEISSILYLKCILINCSKQKIIDAYCNEDIDSLNFLKVLKALIEREPTFLYYSSKLPKKIYFLISILKEKHKDNITLWDLSNEIILEINDTMSQLSYDEKIKYFEQQVSFRVASHHKVHEENIENLQKLLNIFAINDTELFDSICNDSNLLLDDDCTKTLGSLNYFVECYPDAFNYPEFLSKFIQVFAALKLIIEQLKTRHLLDNSSYSVSKKLIKNIDKKIKKFYLDNGFDKVKVKTLEAIGRDKVSFSL